MNKPIAVFDLDNCLANDAWRFRFIDWSAANPDDRYRPYHARCGEDGSCHHTIVRAVSEFAQPVFVTARTEEVREVTELWLRTHFSLPYPMVFMRALGDHRPSREFKRATVQSFAHRPAVAFDDRWDVVEMYRALGIPAHHLAVHETCAMTPPTVAGGHCVWDDSMDGAPRQICDANGQVVLALCRWCGKAEAELDAPCTGDPMLKTLAERSNVRPGDSPVVAEGMAIMDQAFNSLEPVDDLLAGIDLELNPATGSVNGQMQDYTRLPHETVDEHKARLRRAEGLDEMPAAPPSRGESMPSPRRNVPDILRVAADVFDGRNAQYGETYRHGGRALLALFGPEGIPAVRTEEDANRLRMILFCQMKLSRYCQNFAAGGHRDSSLDLINYAAMLDEFTK